MKLLKYFNLLIYTLFGEAVESGIKRQTEEQEDMTSSITISLLPVIYMKK